MERGILIKNPNGGIFMGKTEKNNHGKVPKITEEEYAAYVNHLREMSEIKENDGAGGESLIEDENKVK